jgi:hypothetical protein
MLAGSGESEGTCAGAGAGEFVWLLRLSQGGFESPCLWLCMYVWICMHVCVCFCIYAFLHVCTCALASCMDMCTCVCVVSHRAT